MENFSLKEETYKIIGCCMEVHNTLGYGFSESVYKDAMELEFLDAPLPYLREKQLTVFYKERILRHSFIADFICYQKIIVEVKCTNNGIVDDHIAQTLNYLRVSDNQIGLIINFGKRQLEYKRLIL